MTELRNGRSDISGGAMFVDMKRRKQCTKNTTEIRMLPHLLRCRNPLGVHVGGNFKFSAMRRNLEEIRIGSCLD